MPALTRIFIIHMVIHATLSWTPLPVHHHRSKSENCLMGDMTDIQNWLDKNGKLTVNNGRKWSIDLSYNENKPADRLQNIMSIRNISEPVKYLSMAMCGLTAVPVIFRLKDSQGRRLSETLEAVSFYGNKFDNFDKHGVNRYYVNLNATKAREVFNNQNKLHAETSWNIGFRRLDFTNLHELDLRSCSIQYLNDYFLCNMSELKNLYLAGNNIYHISSRAFILLQKLVHLDLSRNHIQDSEGNELAIAWSTTSIFSNLRSLASLDLSYTLISETGVQILSSLEFSLQRLSICYTGIKRLRPEIFRNTSLRYLDVSGNNGILTEPDSLLGLEDTLEVVYADNVGLRSMSIFVSFNKLKVLKLSNNELSVVQDKEAKSLKSLVILDLSYNRVISWFHLIFSLFENLKFLSLKVNNINIIKQEMIEDLRNITYVGLADNFFICTCFARELLDIAAINEIRYKHEQMKFFNQHMFFKQNQKINNISWDFHKGFNDYYDEVDNRNIVSFSCDTHTSSPSCLRDEDDLYMDGNFLLFDYTFDQYKCLKVEDGDLKSFSEIKNCNVARREIIYDDIINQEWNILIMIIVGGCVIIVCLVVGYVSRRRLKYFYITVKNSALLSAINPSEVCNDGSIFHYDVFVSYCNEDRAWVLDHLLPHVERDSNISVCLHERDFQVGLSIFENIVSCMDRSRTIVLIISHRFLLSQWCQFEMHLAQHRLLETRREDLILILLEDIPKRMRPNTLHYLMMTKTYVLWPKGESEQQIFWRRLKKSLVMQKLKNNENSSLV